jgi:hypothetical protein
MISGSDIMLNYQLSQMIKLIRMYEFNHLIYILTYLSYLKKNQTSVNGIAKPDSVLASESIFLFLSTLISHTVLQCASIASTVRKIFP